MEKNKVYLEPSVIINEVASYYHLPSNLIISCWRKKEYIKAKHIAMTLCRKYTKLSLRDIGYHFNGKGHCDVLYAIKSVTNQNDIYRIYNKQLNEILEKLKLRGEEIQLENKYKNYETDNV